MPLKVIYQTNESVVEDDATALIGSDAEAQIRIVRPGISRRHAVISHDGVGWKIEDAGSRNGTFLDGKRIQTMPITASTTLFLGHPSDGESVTLEPVPADGEASGEADPAPAAPADVPATVQARPSAAAPVAAVQATKVQSATSASDIELAQLTAALRDQISAVRGLTWSVWAMIAVTAVLAVMTLFVGILSN